VVVSVCGRFGLFVAVLDVRPINSLNVNDSSVFITVAYTDIYTVYINRPRGS